MENNFKKIYFYKFKGYGTFLELFFIKLFSNKYYLFRDYPGRVILSEIGKSNFNNYKNVYLEAEKKINLFYTNINSMSTFYKDVNLPLIAKRDLHLDLSELLNNIHQLKSYQEKEQVIYKVEYAALSLFRNYGLQCKASLSLSCLYTVLDLIYFVYSRIKNINAIISIDYTLNTRKKNTNDVAKKNILTVLSQRSSNTAFLKVMDEISYQFNTFWIKPELDDKFSDKFLQNYNNKPLIIKQPKSSHKKYFQNKINIHSNSLDIEIHKYLLKKLSILMMQNKRRYKKGVDVVEAALNETQPDAVIVGLTHYWLYNICVQSSKLKKIKVIYFQDVFFIENSFFNIQADHIVIGSNTVQENLVNHFKKTNSEITNSNIINNFLHKNINDLNQLQIDYKDVSLNTFREKHNICNDKKIILLIGDPGELYNSKEHKFNDEFNLLKALRHNEEYFVIIKVHPGDSSGISELALKKSENNNAIVSKNIDIYECMIECDLIVASSSTAVIEGLILKKYILLSNYHLSNLFIKAVEHGVAHYINMIEDIPSLLENKNHHMREFEVNVVKYFEEAYGSNEKKENLSEILKSITDA